MIQVGYYEQFIAEINRYQTWRLGKTDLKKDTENFEQINNKTYYLKHHDQMIEETDKMIINIKELKVIIEKIIDEKIQYGELIKPKSNNIESIKSKIIEVFCDIDFIKQICYENDVANNELKLLIIYQHDNFEYSEDIMFDRFFKLEDLFPDIYMELMTLLPSEVGPSDLNKTTTLFKKE